jgi:hypothetical protein
MRLPAALCRIFRGLLPPLALAVGLLAVSALLIACSVTAENLSNDGVLSGDVAKQIWVQSVPRDSPFRLSSISQLDQGHQRSFALAETRPRGTIHSARPEGWTANIRDCGRGRQWMTMVDKTEPTWT